MKRLLTAVVLSGVCLTASAIGQRALADPVSPVVLPKPDIPLAFNHKQHLKLNLKCTLCHRGVLQSKLASDNLFPVEATCTTCHNVKARNPAKVFPKATCDTCHPGFQKGDGDPPKIRPRKPNLTFPHRTHTIIGILCTDCHKGLDEATQPSWDHIPNMERCLTCHNGNDAPAQCRTCHPMNGPRLQTRFSSGVLAPQGRFRNDDHSDPQWAFTHCVAALASDAYCMSCHAQSECLDCHAGSNKPTFHANNYSLLHSRDAYTDGGQCMSCHVAARDCEGCHAETNLTLATRATGGAGKVHPEGWDSFIPGPNHHGPLARRSVSGCASCHPEEDCIACHASRTLKINPHPPGFDPSQFGTRTEAACRKCHDVIPK